MSHKCKNNTLYHTILACKASFMLHLHYFRMFQEFDISYLKNAFVLDKGYQKKLNYEDASIIYLDSI